MALITIPTDATLYVVQNKATTTLSAGIDNSQTTVPVADTSKFVSTGGFAVISDGTNEEMIKYTGISGGDLTGVTRNYDSAGAFAFLSADDIEEKVFAEHHNAVRTGLQTLATGVRSMQTGAAAFSGLLVQQGSTGTGSLDTGAAFANNDTTGTVEFRFDSYEEDRSFEIGPEATTFLAMMRFYGDHTAVDLATNRLRIYTGTNIDDGGELYCDINPTVGPSPTAVAYDFRSKYDLLDAGSYIVRAQNQSTTLFGVTKDSVEVNMLKITGASEHMFLTPLTIDPVSPADGTVWFKDVASVLTLNVRVGGVTKSVTLS